MGKLLRLHPCLWVGILLVIAGTILLLNFIVGNFLSKEEQSLNESRGTGGAQLLVEEERIALHTEPVISSKTVFVLEEWEPMRLIIPDIDVDREVLTGGVFREDLLSAGPVHFEMSDLPSTERGNVAIAAHRRGDAAFFHRLHELEKGAPIYLQVSGNTFVYEVAWIRIVDPNDWSVIESTEYSSLTLQTCEPKDSPATHRLIVRAHYTELMPARADNS